MANLCRQFVFVVAVGLLAGCSSTSTLNHRDLHGPAFYKVNEVARGKVADVTLADGRQVRATSVLVGAETTSFFNIETGHIEQVTTASVREVSVIRASRGALVGLGAGIVIGTAIGVTRASVEGDDPNPADPLYTTQQEKYALFPAAYSTYSSLVTVPLGAIFGVRQRYRFDLPATVATTTDPQPLNGPVAGQ